MSEQSTNTEKIQTLVSKMTSLSEAWSNAIFKPILEKINGAGKKGTPQLTLKDVKQFFRLFLNCSLVNPEFTSQEKTKLSAPNVKTKIETKHINNIMKWDVIEKIKDIIDAILIAICR